MRDKIWILFMIVIFVGLFNILFIHKMTLDRTIPFINQFDVYAQLRKSMTSSNHSQKQPNHSKTLTTTKTSQSVIFDEYYAEYIGHSLHIGWKVVSNTAFLTGKCQIQLTLINTGDQPLIGGDWEIYFDSNKMIEPGSLPNGEKILSNHGVKLRHYKGTQFILSPIHSFTDLQPRSERQIYFQMDAWYITRSDSFPNWYIQFPGSRPVVIENTRTLNYVSNFSQPEQWKRNKNDIYNPYTAQDRYRRYNDSINYKIKTPELSIPIIPKPLHVITSPGQGTLMVDSSWLIRHPQTLTSEGNYLKGETGLSIDNSQTSKKVIELQIGDVIHPLTKKQFEHTEAYKLEVSSGTSWITITGASANGVFNGIQSFLALYSTGGAIHDVTIVDQPRLSYRGMHVDVSRNFHQVSSILKLIDGMAMVKMNKLHLHLSDDEGWRLEIPGLPELTDIGARRCFNVNACLLPQLGSGPNSDTSGSGHYTIKDYKKILQHAASRHIQVIPEFDMPGHARAAIKAMEKRYNVNVHVNKTAAEEYLLHDLHDNSRYRSIQAYNDNAANPCLNSTYMFLGRVIDELIKMHRNIQPLTLYHFGGDEVGGGAWVDSPKCQKLNHGKSISTHNIKEMFFKRVADITSKKGLNMAAWEDGVSEKQKPFENVLPNSKYVTYAYTWKDVWGETFDITYRMANAGYKVIMCQATHLYFDHPQEPDPEEPGLIWATRFTDTKKVFSFIVEDIYENIDVSVIGHPLDKNNICSNKEVCPPLLKPENIVGIQAQLWSETVRTADRFDYMIFPRLLAVAERGWHKADWESITDVNRRKADINEDWLRFSEILGRNYLWRLDKLNIRYRISPPGGLVEKNVIQANTEFPSQSVEYFIPDKEIWSVVSNNTKYTSNIPIRLRTRNHDGSRTSGTVVLHPVEPLPAVDQSGVDLIANNLRIEIEERDTNKKINGVILKNVGKDIIPCGNWELNLQPVICNPIFSFDGEDFVIEHVNKTLKIAPTGIFGNLKPGDAKKITFKNQFWFDNQNGSKPDIRVRANGMESKVVKNFKRLT